LNSSVAPGAQTCPSLIVRFLEWPRLSLVRTKKESGTHESGIDFKAARAAGADAAAHAAAKSLAGSMVLEGQNKGDTNN